MGLLLSEALKLRCLKNVEVIGGNQEPGQVIQGIGLLNPTLFDTLPENQCTSLINRHSEGELLFFTDPCESSSHRLVQFIGELSKKNIAGLVVKPSGPFESIPGEVTEALEKLKLPLLVLDKDVDMTEILLELLTYIVDNNYPLMEQTYNLSKSFANIVLSDGDVFEIAQVLADYCRADVQVYGLFNEILAEAKPLALQNQSSLGTPISISKEVALSREIRAYIKLSKHEQPLKEPDLMALNSAATHIAFVLLKKQEAEEVERSYRHEFLNDLVDGDIPTRDEIVQRGTFYGFNLEKGYILLLFNIDSIDDIFPKRGLKESYTLLRKALTVIFKTYFSTSKEMIVWNRSNNIIILHPLPEDLDEKKSGQFKNKLKTFSYDTAEKIKNIVEENIENISVTIGIGTYYPEITDLCKGYKEAVTAVKTGKLTWGKEGVYHYEDLGIYRIISNYPDKAELKAFVNETLGALIQYDEKNNTHLLITLEEMLNHHGNQKITAAKLFVHPKTLAYRKNRIQDILGISLDHAEHVLNIYMALKIKRVLTG